jgi:integrase/recombinase XerD
MWRLYRRHLKRCPYARRGQRHWTCHCPIWVDGRVDGRRVRTSTNLIDWERAKTLLPGWEQAGRVSSELPAKTNVGSAGAKTLYEAWQEFIKRKGATQRLNAVTIYKYCRLQRQMEEFAKLRDLKFLQDFDLDGLEVFQSNWKEGPLSSLKKLERLKSFFNFACSRGWIRINPAANLRAPKVSQKPTLPFTREEMERIALALDRYPDKSGRTGRENACRLKALVFLLRYSGLRIGDAVRCSTKQIHGTKLYLYTQKTGQPVYCPLPTEVVEVLDAVPQLSPGYFFWTGESKQHTVVGTWQRSLRKLFTLAGIQDGHAHRFRDTFAVELLLTGTSIEEVAVLLGHSNIRVTQRHYNPWILARQRQLESSVQKSWERDPILSTLGTSWVRREDWQETNLLIMRGKELVPAVGLEPTT